MSHEWVYNFGKVVTGIDESFWLFPIPVFEDRNYFVHSPVFSYLGDKWRFAIKIYQCFPSVQIYLWLETYPQKCKYILRSKVDLPNGETNMHYADLIDGYGFNAFEVRKSEMYSCCGKVKILFEMQKKPDTEDIVSCTSVEKTVSKNTSEDDQISEESSDEESNENECLQSTDKGIKNLLENFRQLFLNGQMSDVVLQVDSREFKVHKAILVARSPVFVSMFQHDMKEKSKNVVDIPDCTAESFEVFLEYIYCGNAGNMSTSNVYNVYYAADKYQVEDLKEKCVEYMTNNISVETFCDVIALSLRHGESKLQNIATHFFCENIKNIIKTVQWQKYLDENSTQANELLIKALNA